MVRLISPPQSQEDAGLRFRSSIPLAEELSSFATFGAPTICSVRRNDDVPTFLNEFWTSKQRAASRLHEISYRACFKPQLPRFFIERLTVPGSVVFDPFMGRGTTLLEAALLGRVPIGSDANPLCRKLIAPRLNPPRFAEVQARLDEIDFTREVEMPENLLVFYHPRTLRQLCALRACLLDRETLDPVDAWIQMVALNRLTGHSPGFFSVYTMPPNQAVSVESQRRINLRLRQEPGFRDVPALILGKTKKLLGDLTETTRQTLHNVGERAKIFTGPSENVPEIADESVDLVVTSPPFLDVVDYAGDNWLRGWFIGLDVSAVKMSVQKQLPAWEASMGRALSDIRRTLRPGGWAAFEVGEVRRGKIQLENSIVPAGIAAGLEPELILINSQNFTKTANCWGVSNNRLGTNTNRIVLFRKP